jgi:hypothetical protein
MARAGKVAVSITADPSGLERGLRGAEKDLSRFGDRGSKSLSGLKTAALGAGAAITTGLVYGLKESVEAAVEAEKSQRALEAQLRALNISYKAHGAEIDAVIQKTSKLAGLDDEDLADAFTRLVRASGSVNESLKQMGLVADIARARNLDVAKAGDLVAKVMAGNTSALSRYGIVLKENSTAQEALTELQRRFSGQAEAYGKTAAGAQDRFNVSLENLKETVGQHVLPLVTKLAEKASGFVDQMQKGTGAGGEFVGVLKDIYGTVKPVVEFFVKHPKYIAIAVGAWATYKAAALAAAVYSKGQILGIFGPRAIAQTNVAAAAAGRASGGKFGKAFGLAAGAAIAPSLNDAIKDITGVDTGPDIFDVMGWVPDIIQGKQPEGIVPPKPGVGFSPTGQWTGTGKRPPSSGGPASHPDSAGRRSVPMASASAFSDPGASGNSGGSQKPSSKPRPSSGSSAPSSSTSRPVSSGAVTGGATSGSNTGIIALGKQLQAEGYIVGEHPAFGGVGGHTETSYHYRGMAIDVNGGPGGEPGSLDALYARLRGRPGVVELLWRVADHYDHLHVAVAGSVNPLTGASAGGSPSSVGSVGGTSYASSVGYSAPVSRPSAYDRVSGRLDLIGLREGAGLIGAGRAARQTVKTITTALGGKGLGQRERLELMGTRRDAQMELRQRARSQKQSRRENAKSLAGDQLRQGWRFLQAAKRSGTMGNTEFRAAAIRLFESGLAGYYGALNGTDRSWAKGKLQELRTGAGTLGDILGGDGVISDLMGDGAPDLTSFAGTAFDNAALAEAGLTSDTGDDAGVLRGRMGLAEGYLGRARAANDREGIATWASVVGSLRSELEGLSSAVSENTAQLAEMRKQSADHYRTLYLTSEAQSRALARGFADLISGEIGGRVVRGMQTPAAAGQLARY